MDLIPCLFLVNQQRSFYVVVLMTVLLFSSTCFLLPADGYDPLDPNGNLNIRWDVLQQNDGGTQDVRLTIVNYQLFRHVELPGWKLSWTWPGDEEPVIIDLLPGAPYNKQVANCCKGGVLSSMMQDPGKYLAAFQMHIGSASDSSVPRLPARFTLGLPGYTCGEPFKVPPTKFFEDQGRRRTQALATWNVTCSYSQFRASSAPTCCVSLSAFYNKTIVPCPKCSCACHGEDGAECVKPGKLPPVLQLEHNEPPKPVVQCSDHMCPIRVHWHVKLSYTQYWRVKITVTNLNYVKNYSEWNLVVLHPNLRSVTQVFSFNYKPLNVYGNINDTGMFYGIQYYNDVLLQTGESGNVQTEMLLHKDPGIFTFKEGWAFPRKISFNGEECVMPSPDDYPRLPNTARFDAQAASSIIILLLVLLLTVTVFIVNGFFPATLCNR
ncbi:COBRA-like protein 6 [Sesamum angolense]|uniref:COBRA-like protein n=1 Tax=Sesamum angolense TaxID=2727404 RepID=A0AAE1WYI1_9LAMI|nr:COBRA-like protein 6 [Sesamum angolense]